ncbi:hypothetical protein BGZ94_005318 [Podila epigama]|nr:hypothetical protein BGZ94_005318 [Podila epigama]
MSQCLTPGWDLALMPSELLVSEDRDPLNYFNPPGTTDLLSQGGMVAAAMTGRAFHPSWGLQPQQEFQHQHQYQHQQPSSNSAALAMTPSSTISSPPTSSLSSPSTTSVFTQSLDVDDQDELKVS